MHEPRTVPKIMEWSALLLAIAAVLLGFLAVPVLAWFGVSEVFGISGAGP